MPTDREVLKDAYDAFNARNIERALGGMHPEVDWPNGMEGGYSMAATLFESTGADSGV